jgi:hypothetical protein
MNEKWVILSYWPHEPVQVYGTFQSDTEARGYAEQQGFAVGQGAYDIVFIRDVDEE